MNNFKAHLTKKTTLDRQQRGICGKYENCSIQDTNGEKCENRFAEWGHRR